MGDFEWSVSGLDFAKALNPDKARAAMKRGLSKSMKVVANQVKVETPVDTGRLRAGMTDEVRESGNEIIGVVGNNVEYAPFVELGSSPHFPPPSALAGWAQRHGGLNPFLVARGIAKHGTKAHRMFGRVLESPFAAGIVDRYVSEELRKVIWG
jgi:hypothetical protein